MSATQSRPRPREPDRPARRAGDGAAGAMDRRPMPAEKSLDFGRRPSGCSACSGPSGLASSSCSARRRQCRLAVIGPKFLGHATDLIFAGVIGEQLPAGLMQHRRSTRLRARGNGSLPT